MSKRLNKKGFTLIELLAVIVILAVVMLIGVTAVGPIMTKARKSSLGTEGLALIEAAKVAHQTENIEGIGTGATDGTVCYSINYLKSHGYYDKSDSNYHGSVLYENLSGRDYYTFMISNKDYMYKNDGSTLGISAETYQQTGIELAVPVSDASVLDSCGLSTDTSGITFK